MFMGVMFAIVVVSGVVGYNVTPDDHRIVENAQQVIKADK